MSVELESMIVRLLGDSTSYMKMMKDVEEEARRVTVSLESLGKQMTRAITGPLSDIGSVALHAFAKFDLALTKSTSIMKVTEDEIEQIRKASLELSTKSGQAPATLATSFYSLASAGLDAKQSITALPAVMQFAAAGAFDLSRSIELATSAQNALGLRSADAAKNLQNLTRVTDVVARISKIAQGTTEQFAVALARDAAATSKSYGMELEQTVAVLGAYHDSNIRAELAGGSFARMLRLLAASSRSSAAAHKQLGFTVFEAGGKMRNVADIIGNLEDIMGKLSPEARSATLEMLGFKTLSQKAIMPLIGMSQKIRDFEAELKKAGGTTANIAQKQGQAFANQMKRIGNIVTVVRIEIGTMLAPVMLRLAGIVEYVAQAWRGLSTEIRMGVVVAGGLAAVIGPLAVLLGLLGPSLAGGLALLGSMFAGVMLPVAGLKTALMGAVRLFGVLGVSALALLNPLTALLAPFRLFLSVLLLWFNPMFVLARTVLSLAAVMLVLIRNAGGFADVWRGVESAAVGFWQWLMPIAAALRDLGTTTIRLVVAGLLQMGEAMLKSMTSMAKWLGLDKIEIDWLAVQQFIVGSIKVLEFALVNFGGIASGIFSALAMAFRPLTDAILGGVLAIKDWGASLFATQPATKQVTKEGMDITRILINTTAGLLTAVVAWKALATVIAIASAVTAFFKLNTLASLAATLSYYIVTIALIPAILSLQAAQWLWNVALLATNALLVAGTIAGLVVVAGALAATYATIAGVLWGVYEAGKAVLYIFAAFPTTTGPLGAVTGILREWWDVIQLVYTALSVDMELAWRLLAAGGALAIAQVQALWPPLWTFIRDGSYIVWDAIATNFKGTFATAILEVMRRVGKLYSAFGLTKMEEGAMKAIEDWEEEMDSMTTDAGNAIDSLTRRFKFPDSTPEIKKARKEIDGLAKELDDAIAQKEFEDWLAEFDEVIPKNKLASDAAKTGEAIGNGLANPIKKARHEVEKFDAALMGSAEMFSRLEKWRDLMAMPKIDVGDVKNVAAAVAPAAVAVAAAASPAAAPIDSATVEHLVMPPQILAAPGTTTVVLDDSNQQPGTKNERDERIVEFLQMIAEYTGILANKEPIEFDGAGFGE